MSTLHTDEFLYESYLNGDHASFKELYDRCSRDVWTLLVDLVHRAEVADDLTQEVFTKLHVYGNTFRHDSPLRPWLMRIAHNTAIDYLRSTKRHKAKMTVGAASLVTEDGGELEIEDNSSTVEDELLRKERAEQIRAIVDRLRPYHRQVIMMFYFEDMSHRQISETVAIPLSTVKSRLNKALFYISERVNGNRKAA